MLIDALQFALRKLLCFPRDLASVRLKLVWKKRILSGAYVRNYQLCSNGSLLIINQDKFLSIISGATGNIEKCIGIRDPSDVICSNSIGDIFYLSDGKLKRLSSTDIRSDPNIQINCVNHWIRSQIFLPLRGMWISILQISKLNPWCVYIDSLDRMMVCTKDHMIYFYDAISLERLPLTPIIFPVASPIGQINCNPLGDVILTEEACKDIHQCTTEIKDFGSLITLRSEHSIWPCITWGPDKHLLYLAIDRTIHLQDLEQLHPPVKISGENYFPFPSHACTETVENHLIIENERFMISKYVFCFSAT